MNSTINRTMQEAMQLMQTGDLLAATAAIQRGLATGNPTEADPAPHDDHDAAHDVIEGDFRVVDDEERFASRFIPGIPLPGTATLRAKRSGDGADRPARDVEQQQDRARPNAGFRTHLFHADHGSLSYKLYLPSTHAIEGLPLIVMLHGCTQNPDDFARGTRMNALAETHGFVVAYPAQSAKQNQQKCWNWFRRSDQQRGRGEPALLAALTRDIVAKHRLDTRRVYVAGLSAGGAMAAVLGSTYPDVYAAVGVHSGLPFGIAHDMPSAFAAMRPQPAMRGQAKAPRQVTPIPAIVFHGDRDTTVDPCNGAAVVEQFTTAASASRDTGATASHSTAERGTTARGRRFTRTLFRDAADNVVAEHWIVHGAGHAWFGGDPSGSYADADGPDASAEMIRFFRCHALTIAG